MRLESSMSDVIATRELELVLEDGSKETFLVSIAKPVFDKKGGSYFCPHQIKSNEFSKVINIHGVDLFQALELSIKSISPYLGYLERKRQQK